MKKRLKTTTLIIFFLSVGFTSIAQVQLGVRAGMNRNDLIQHSVNFEEMQPLKTKLGYHIGLVLDYGFTEEMSLTSGISYITKGADRDFDNNTFIGIDIEGSAEFIYNYLEIPINLTFKRNKFQFFGGPYLGIGINGKAVNDYTIIFDDGSEFIADETVNLNPVFSEVNNSDFIDNEEPFNGLDLGINLGVGYHVGSILLSMSYSNGLSDIVPKFEGIGTSNNKLTNQVFSLSASYYMFGSSAKSTEK